MYVIFSADRPCVMRMGGRYLGVVDGFERRTQLDPTEGAVCELQPIGGGLPLCFVLDEHFLMRPPKGITLVYAEEALYVYASDFLPADQSLHILWQKRLGDALLTLTRQGALRLWLDRGRETQLCTLADGLQDCTAARLQEGFLLEGSAAFALISSEGKLLWQAEGRVLSQEPLRAEVHFHGCVGLRAVCEWQNGVQMRSVRHNREPTEATIGLALLECARLGADCTPFLAPALHGRAAALREYLGDYDFVRPTDEPNRLALGYLRFAGIYDMRYVRIELHDGRVSNLIRQ